MYNNNWFGKLLLVLLIIGGLNWGLYGLWGFDAVGWLTGGSFGWIARTIYVIVGISAIAALPGLAADGPDRPERGAP